MSVDPSTHERPDGAPELSADLIHQLEQAPGFRNASAGPRSTPGMAPPWAALWLAGTTAGIGVPLALHTVRPAGPVAGHPAPLGRPEAAEARPAEGASLGMRQDPAASVLAATSEPPAGEPRNASRTEPLLAAISVLPSPLVSAPAPLPAPVVVLPTDSSPDLPESVPAPLAAPPAEPTTSRAAALPSEPAAIPIATAAAAPFQGDAFAPAATPGFAGPMPAAADSLTGPISLAAPATAPFQGDAFAPAATPAHSARTPGAADSLGGPISLATPVSLPLQAAAAAAPRLEADTTDPLARTWRAHLEALVRGVPLVLPVEVVRVQSASVEQARTIPLAVWPDGSATTNVEPPGEAAQRLAQDWVRQQPALSEGSVRPVVMVIQPDAAAAAAAVEPATASSEPAPSPAAAPAAAAITPAAPPIEAQAEAAPPTPVASPISDTGAAPLP